MNTAWARQNAAVTFVSGQSGEGSRWGGGSSSRSKW